MSGYCDIAPNHVVHASYHNTEYGFPVYNERVLFERLSLEIMQAGLSWEIVLKKRKALNRAFHRFSVTKIAAYDETDVARLLGDETIIRNRLKIMAIIENAKRVLRLRKTHKGFYRWLDVHHPLSKSEWIKLFKSTFKFTGGEIVGEFLMSIGYLKGAHHMNCPTFKEVLKHKPAWIRSL